jgi:hypothetical protein
MIAIRLGRDGFAWDRGRAVAGPFLPRERGLTTSKTRLGNTVLGSDIGPSLARTYQKQSIRQMRRNRMDHIESSEMD